MRTCYLIFLLLLLSYQTSRSQNMVFNPGFDETDPNLDSTFDNRDGIKAWNFRVFGERSYYVGVNFDEGACYWCIAAFNNGLRPKSGAIMANITSMSYYLLTDEGCQGQDFMSGKLSNALEKGKAYYFELWYSLDWMGEISATNKLGVYFSDGASLEQIDRWAIKPDLISECLLYTHPAQWKKLSGYFVARSNSDRFVIGNFARNDSVKYVVVENPFEKEKIQDTLFASRVRRGRMKPEKPRLMAVNSSYFIDDVLVVRAKEAIDKGVFGCDACLADPKPGQLVPLNNVWFEISKARLLSQSQMQLDELVKVLKSHPSLKIEIIGHTDRPATDSYTQALSVGRAKAVYDYLLQKGIGNTRLTYVWFGVQRPANRKTNHLSPMEPRKVEIRFLE